MKNATEYGGSDNISTLSPWSGACRSQSHSRSNSNSNSNLSFSCELSQTLEESQPCITIICNANHKSNKMAISIPILIPILMPGISIKTREVEAISLYFNGNNILIDFTLFIDFRRARSKALLTRISSFSSRLGTVRYMRRFKTAGLHTAATSGKHTSRRGSKRTLVVHRYIINDKAVVDDEIIDVKRLSLKSPSTNSVVTNGINVSFNMNMNMKLKRIGLEAPSIKSESDMICVRMIDRASIHSTHSSEQESSIVAVCESGNVNDDSNNNGN